MYIRFNDSIVDLQNLGKKLESNELNGKLLASLPIEWRLKVMVIEEVKNLKTITMVELIVLLITHENTLERYKKRWEITKKKKDLAFQTLLDCGNNVDEEGYMALIRNSRNS